MESKHTPGPWKRYEGRELAQHRRAVDDGTIPVFADDTAVACLIVYCGPNGAKDEATQEANAALIAAAPDLLAALETWARYAKNNGWTDEEHNDGDPANGWITRTNAAISRAKGGR